MESLNFRRDPRISDDAREKLRAFCGTLGENIVGLANELGVKVFAEDLWPYESGYLEYNPEFRSVSGYRIVINENHSPERQRFTVAHELAHFLLHREDIDYLPNQERHRIKDPEGFFYAEPKDKTREIEANRFAAELLMSPNLFVPVYKRLGGDAVQIARVFEVSVQAATLRISALKRANRIA